MSPRDHDSDGPEDGGPARAVALVALLPVLLVAGVVLALADAAALAERGIRRWMRRTR